MKRVILSADDFGKSHDRNQAIDYAMKHNLVKSAALIMGSEFTDDESVLRTEADILRIFIAI